MMAMARRSRWPFGATQEVMSQAWLLAAKKWQGRWPRRVLLCHIHLYSHLYNMISIIMQWWLQLLGGDVYHYHAKVSIKEPEKGGAHIWHQDYG